MNTKDYFKDMYTDFFGVESLPKIEVKDNNMGSQEKMASLFLKINDLYISNESKELLKKIIEYMRKYNEKIENNYIPFNISIKVSNDTLSKDIKDILTESAIYYNYINKESLDISFYKFDNNVNFDTCGCIYIHNIKAMALVDDNSNKLFIYNLIDYLNKTNKTITIISGNQDEINKLLLDYQELNKYFDFVIEGNNPDIGDIYNNILKNTNLDNVKNVSLLEYITNTYNKDIDYIKYQNDLIKYISFNKDIPKYKTEKTIDEIFTNLNELVGLSEVKKVLYQLVDIINLKEKTKDSLNIQALNLHMVFLGNPGTGKTTIARMIANILYDLKYIKENKLIEVSAKDLVAEYVGQTSPKTMAVIEKSLNGVLFIDEAYSLTTNDMNSYNGEAIATLIQAMENYRDKLVVIFAGYTKEMHDFLNSNPGISSRIGYTLDFPDYTTDELIQIFLGMTNKAGFIVTDDAINYLKDIINKYRNMNNFGNARFVRNIYEKTIITHASNVKNKKQNKILKTITKNDISIDNLILE